MWCKRSKDSDRQECTLCAMWIARTAATMSNTFGIDVSLDVA